MTILFLVFSMSLSFADMAMKQTQDFIKNPQERSELAKTDPKAKKAMDDVKSLSGGDSDLENKMYEISSSIFGNFEGKTPEEIQNLLKKAQKDPKAFFESLTPAQREAIKKAADRIPAVNAQTSK